MEPLELAQKVNDIISKSGGNLRIDIETPLIGSISPLDSLTLIQLCAWLESIPTDNKGVFKWSAEDMMNASSFFMNCSTLAAEFNRQTRI